MSSNGQCCSIVWLETRRHAVNAHGITDVLKLLAWSVIAGTAVLRMSSNGRCCSIGWPETCCYAVCGHMCLCKLCFTARNAITGTAVLRTSSNGGCCSIVWPEARRYAVYAQGATDDWHKVDEESGTSVAWAGASSTYAVLHQPKVSYCPIVLTITQSVYACLRHWQCHAVFVKTLCGPAFALLPASLQLPPVLYTSD